MAAGSVPDAPVRIPTGAAEALVEDAQDLGDLADGVARDLEADARRDPPEVSPERFKDLRSLRRQLAGITQTLEIARAMDSNEGQEVRR